MALLSAGAIAEVPARADDAHIALTTSSAIAASQIQTQHRSVRVSQWLVNLCEGYRTNAVCATPDNELPNQIPHRVLSLAAKRIRGHVTVIKGEICSSNITCPRTRSSSEHPA
jgi:hypothetical protein